MIKTYLMKIKFDSPVVLIFSAICAGVYLLQYLEISGGMFVLIPQFEPSSPSWYFRLFSHAIGHGSSEHLMGNLAFILLLGPIVEKTYGAVNLIIMMLTTALLTGLIHIMFSNAGLLGASGIVFMMILLVSLINFKNKEIPLTFILILIVYIGKEILGTFSDDNIAHSTHIVGGLVGAFFGFYLNKNKIKKETQKEDVLTIK